MKKIGIIADYYLGWAGGTYILSAILNSLLSDRSISIQTFLLVNGNRYPGLSINHSSLIKVSVNTNLGLSKDDLLQDLIESTPNLDAIYFYNDLIQAVLSLGVGLVGPTTINLGKEFPVPWVAYIPDFQHCYLSHLFSDQECLQRDNHFRALVTNSNAIMVNSYSVVRDVERFYPGLASSKRMFVFPELFPHISHQDLGSASDVLNKLQITTPFILSASQAWVHKQHDLIIKSFHKFLQESGDLETSLVFTGAIDDYRFGDSAKKIESLVQSISLSTRVRRLGHVSKKDLHSLIFSADAVVQASLFEGGSGASGTIEAALLGTKIIASDISANRELKFGSVTYFSKSSIDQLADAIKEARLSCSTKSPPFTDEEVRYLRRAAGSLLCAMLVSLF